MASRRQRLTTFDLIFLLFSFFIESLLTLNNVISLLYIDLSDISPNFSDTSNTFAWKLLSSLRFLVSFNVICKIHYILFHFLLCAMTVNFSSHLAVFPFLHNSNFGEYSLFWRFRKFRPNMLYKYIVLLLSVKLRTPTS